MLRPLAPLIAIALAFPATALAATEFTDDSFGQGRGSVSIQAETNQSGEFTKITDLAWERLPCGPNGRPNTGSFPSPIHVSDDHFSGKGSLPVGDGITVRVRGDFVKDGAKIKGTIKATGECDSGGKRKFAASANAEG